MSYESEIRGVVSGDVYAAVSLPNGLTMSALKVAQQGIVNAIRGALPEEIAEPLVIQNLLVDGEEAIDVPTSVVSPSHEQSAIPAEPRRGIIEILNDSTGESIRIPFET